MKHQFILLLFILGFSNTGFNSNDQIFSGLHACIKPMPTLPPLEGDKGGGTQTRTHYPSQQETSPDCRQPTADCLPKEKSPISTDVYVCSGKTIGKYHYSKSCRGLNACVHEIKKMTKEQAKSEGYGLCGWED
jgi:hypothetical protein